MAARTEQVDRAFGELLAQLGRGPLPPALAPDAPVKPGTALTAAQALALFESQATSRHLDYAARALRARGHGYYTIGSAGHEGNVVLGALTRHTDPALLHYRSGALFVERARQRPELDAVTDILLGMVASVDDPASGGRHKVWGSAPLTVIPQTSTIASHLPKSVGTAYFIERANHFRLPLPFPRDALVVCSFGDASVNHATALAGFNSASFIAERGLKLPLLFVCEDNGWGISVRTPPEGVKRVVGHLQGVRYFWGDGGELAEAWEAARAAVAYVRERRRPAVLHLSCLRFFGHAGSDIEITYRDEAEIAADESKDPLRRTAHLLVRSGAATPDALRERYEAIRERVAHAAAEVVGRERHHGAGSLGALRGNPGRWEARAEAGDAPVAPADRRAALFGGELPEDHPRPRHMAMLLSWALADLAAENPGLLVFGEDVGKKGGVYHVTAGLQDRIGRGRVFDTILDETTILGMAIGAGLCGFLPVPEIQYLAYIHNALDQIRGEACSQQFFSDGRYRNPMVVRVASFAYQEGFGGHFHNDNSVCALLDIPELIVAVPSRGDDAVTMLRTACHAARTAGEVVAFCEPIALYHQKDRLAEGDGGWCFRYPEPAARAVIGRARVYDTAGGDAGGAPAGDPADAVIVTYGNGVRLALQAVAAAGARVRVVDLRWLKPWDQETVVREAAHAGRLLVVDEGRRPGNIAPQVVAAVAAAEPGVRTAVVTGEDTFIPLGDAWRSLLPSAASVGDALAQLLS